MLKLGLAVGTLSRSVSMALTGMMKRLQVPNKLLVPIAQAGESIVR